MVKKIEQKKTNRCIGLDVLKCFATFFVLVCHYPFTNDLMDYVTRWARFVVPIFFMTTGFFYSSTVKRNKEIVHIKKILFLVVSSNIIYLMYGIARYLLNGNLSTYIANTFNLQSLIEFLFFNESPFAGHLWYLNTLLYTLIIAYFANKFKILRFLNYLIPVLLAVDLVFGKYSILIFGQEFPYIFVRNFLFVGLPYFLLGNLIHNHYDKLNKVFSTPLLIILSIVFTITSILERFMIIQLNANTTREHFISTTFFSIAIFLLAHKFYSTEKTPAIINSFATIGQRYTAWIYIIHPIVITFSKPIFAPILAKVSFIQYIVPIVLFFVTYAVILLFNKCYNYIIKKIPIKKKAN